jgi:hypothetical protein
MTLGTRPAKNVYSIHDARPVSWRTQLGAGGDLAAQAGAKEKGRIALPLLRIADRRLLEPLIRRLFREPRNRRVGARVLHQGSENLRILCLAGAFCPDTAQNWGGWIADLKACFPNANITVINGFYYYWPEETDVMNQIIAEGLALLSDEQPTIIIAFSFGGLLAKAMVDRAERHGVLAIVTLATEHRGHLPRIAETRDLCLGVPLDVDVPTYSFGGLFDMIVWPWTSYSDRSLHRSLLTSHFAFMRSPTTRKKVLSVVSDIVRRHHAR